MRATQYFVDTLAKHKNQRELLASQKLERQKNLTELQSTYNSGILPAQAFLQSVASQTQNKVKFHIQAIAQEALDSLWPGKYEFCMDFRPNTSGKTEAFLYLKDGDEELDPMDSNGGTAVDLLSITLQVAILILSRVRKTLIMDEPMKFVSRGFRETMARFLRALSADLGIQFIVITHDDSIEAHADKLFLVQRRPLQGTEYLESYVTVMSQGE